MPITTYPNLPAPGTSNYGYLNIPFVLLIASGDILASYSGKMLYQASGDGPFTIGMVAALTEGDVVSFLNMSASDLTLDNDADCYYADTGAVNTVVIPQYNSATAIRIDGGVGYYITGTSGCTTT